MNSNTVRIGGASGFWGDSDVALPQLLTESLDYIVFDYLAEITMSIMAMQRARDPNAGYARDFVTNIAANLGQIAAKGVTIISNAGGVNPEGCAAALRDAIAQAGFDLTVGVVTGDNLMGQLDHIRAEEMFTGEAFPVPSTIASANAYLGAFPIAACLAGGADIVVTGRCVDSAVTLGALIHEFGWQSTDLDLLAQGSLAGHINECGTQVTGGNFTDWRDQSFADIGYPIMECEADGSFVATKVANTGGRVTRATVGEQMLYEIGDPAAYYLPDVVCDFTDVGIEEIGENRVRVTGARGAGVPTHYKASLTYDDGYKLSALFFMIGEDAAEKVHVFCEAALERTKRRLAATNLGDFTEVHIELMGGESHYGDFADVTEPRELTFKIAVRHPDAKACSLLLKEATGLALSAPPGLALYTGGRPKPQKVTRLFSILIDKEKVSPCLIVPAVGEDAKYVNERLVGFPKVHSEPIKLFRASPPPAPEGPTITAVPLHALAWVRSGDKGDKSNIGVMARDPDYLPWIWAALTEDAITKRFAHFSPSSVERFHLPGTASMNILLHAILGGGGMASLRNDSQGKAYGQILSAMPIPIPDSIAKTLDMD